MNKFFKLTCLFIVLFFGCTISYRTELFYNKDIDAAALGSIVVNGKYTLCRYSKIYDKKTKKDEEWAETLYIKIKDDGKLIKGTHINIPDKSGNIELKYEKIKVGGKSLSTYNSSEIFGAIIVKEYSQNKFLKLTVNLDNLLNRNITFTLPPRSRK